MKSNAPPHVLLNASQNGSPQKSENTLHPRWFHSQVPCWLNIFSLLLILIGTLLSQIGVPVAFAAGLPQNGAGTPPLKYAGAWVQYHPKVYLVFWGPKWQQDADQVIGTVQQTFDNLAGSQYNNIIRQYNNQSSDLEGYVHNDVDLIDTWIDPSTPPNGLFMGVENIMGGEIKDEAAKAFTTHWNLPQDKNIQILVFPQQGSTYREIAGYSLMNACGMHTYDPDHSLAYGWIRYSSDDNCNFVGTVKQNITWTAVHEYSEIATDPHIYRPLANGYIWGSGWHTNPGILIDAQTPIEVADLCENYNSSNSTPLYSTPSGPGISSINLSVPYLWSNWSNACMLAEGQNYWSPDTTLVYKHKHTVQGGILNKYQSVYNQLGYTTFQSLVGAPITEETPILGGAVSYFSDQVCSGGYTIPSASQNGGNGLASGSAIYASSLGTYEVHGCIYQVYTSVGGPAFLGFPLTDESPLYGGRVSYFSGQQCGNGGAYGSGSAVYAAGSAGTHEVHGCIYTKYVAVSGPEGLLGFPVSNEVSLPNGLGQVSYFAGQKCAAGGLNNSGSAIYAGYAGVYAVKACIYAKYSSINGPSYLGMPVSDEMGITGGQVSYFAGQKCAAGGLNNSGSAIYAGYAGVYAVKACIYTKYSSINGPSYLGMPVSDEMGIAGGQVSYFAGQKCAAGGPNSSGSAIYNYSNTGTYEVHGCIYARYIAAGGPGGKLSFPVSNEYTNSAGNRESDFVGGSIVFQNGAAIVTYNCVGTGTCI